MMFATLDDVEGQVEMLVFKADQAESAAVIAARRDRPRPRPPRPQGPRRDQARRPGGRALRTRRGGDRRGAERRPSAPSGPLRGRRSTRPRCTDGAVEELKAVFEHHKGEAEVHLAIATASGEPTSCKLGERLPGAALERPARELDHVLGADCPGCLSQSEPLGSRGPASLDFIHAATRDEDRRVPPVPLLLRQDGRAARLRRDAAAATSTASSTCSPAASTSAACRRSSRAKVELEAVLQPGGFGGVKMTGDALPHCQFSVERAYEGERRVLRLRQPPLLRLHRRAAPRACAPSTCATSERPD